VSAIDIPFRRTDTHKPYPPLFEEFHWKQWTLLWRAVAKLSALLNFTAAAMITQTL
jgi:hypothetical protein